MTRRCGIVLPRDDSAPRTLSADSAASAADGAIASAAPPLDFLPWRGSYSPLGRKPPAHCKSALYLKMLSLRGRASGLDLNFYLLGVGNGRSELYVSGLLVVGSVIVWANVPWV